MQSKNQVVICGISIFENRPLSRTVRPTELVKRDRHPTLPVPPGHQTLFLLLQCSGRVLSKNGVDLVEVSNFYKSEKTSNQTVRLKKINSSAFVPYCGRLVF